MKHLIISFALLCVAVCYANAQEVSGRSAPFSYTYGLNKYFSAEQFKEMHPLLVQRYRKEILADIKQREELFAPRGEFETDLDYKRRMAKTTRFKYDVLKKYRKQAWYHGSVVMVLKVTEVAKQNYLYILERMFSK